MSDLAEWRWRSFESVLRHVCVKRRPRRVLEWGPGLSTEIVLETCPDASVLTVEHDPKWEAKAKERLAGKGDVEIAKRVISMKGGLSDGYVNHPVLRNLRENGGVVAPEYDLVFVDGRFRCDCLVAAHLLVRPDGVVVVHDTHRGNYLDAIRLFRHWQQFAELRTAVMSKSPMPWLEGAGKGIGGVLSDVDTLDDLERRLVSGKPFTYLRFGDADLYFMVDPNFGGNRRHDPVPGLSRELRGSFAIDHPDYLIGCVAGGRVFKSKEDELKEIAARFHTGRTYHSAVALHMAYGRDPERFAAFCRNSFGGRRVLMVGGAAICRDLLVRKVFNVTATIELTDRNAYQGLDAQMERIRRNVPKFDVMVSALGQATRVLGGRLWDEGARDIQYFDVGSAVDALAGRELRSWIRKYAGRREEYRRMFLG